MKPHLPAELGPISNELEGSCRAKGCLGRYAPVCWEELPGLVGQVLVGVGPGLPHPHLLQALNLQGLIRAGLSFSSFSGGWGVSFELVTVPLIFNPPFFLVFHKHREMERISVLLQRQSKILGSYQVNHCNSYEAPKNMFKMQLLMGPM